MVLSGRLVNHYHGFLLIQSWAAEATQASNTRKYEMLKQQLAFPIVLAGILLAIFLFGLETATSDANSTHFTVNTSTNNLTSQTSVTSPVMIVVDDFEPQPYQGQTIYFYNRLEGDRGALNEATVSWGQGAVTTTIAAGKNWGGIWLSLNHPITKKLPVNFSKVLPDVIQPAYQSEITNVTVKVIIGTVGTNLKLELKNSGNIAWQSPGATLLGGQQTLSYDIPPLGDINELVIVLDQAVADNSVTIEDISFKTTTQITDVAQVAFVWSYGMLLNNWNPTTGLIRDNGKFPSGAFEAIQSTGSLAAATAMAYQLGVVDRADAITIVNTISDTLLTDLPRYHGLWPHWVISSTGTITIAANTEWSSVDTVIAAIGLLDAQVALDLDTTGTTQMLQDIDWDDLKQPDGISHGYRYDGSVITSSWDTFGGESWLVDLAYAAAKKEVPPLKYPLSPTANGSGFIDELAWLFVLPPSMNDIWGADWSAYRMAAVVTQTTYYTPATCFYQLGLFGLSAAEVPIPSVVSETQIYQPFGVGGRFSPPNDGSSLLGQPVVIPHYSAMIASLEPTEAISMWTWLINEGPFSPLNNVESLMFPVGSTCNADEAQWNSLKGSWNLALQTLGWGRYLAQREGKVPILWKATFTNTSLREGYLLLVPNGIKDAYLPLIMRN